MKLVIADKSIEFDHDGFMLDPSLWSDEVALVIAKEDGIEEMSEEHWKVVRFIRHYWLEHDMAPAVRLVCQELGVGVRQLYKLFTLGPARGACRVAGLSKPDGCV
ncbi:MAG: TusE/DsrC/DsvC family sulfur relay protein [Oligoflexia bacterium]|nr:TusE/DsrC/DsvC family sulfur relay protein [Oligoflexia bacterium]MBF0365736.1 TusE/DsrC/DsvC family sulfur relay protein [Oligoflexia bacterium]